MKFIFESQCTALRRYFRDKSGFDWTKMYQLVKDQKVSLCTGILGKAYISAPWHTNLRNNLIKLTYKYILLTNLLIYIVMEYKALSTQIYTTNYICFMYILCFWKI
jgi:hypothetical protein